MCSPVPDLERCFVSPVADLERCFVLWLKLGGLTGVQSSFRSLPHPLQQHGGLSFGYERL